MVTLVTAHFIFFLFWDGMPLVFYAIDSARAETRLQELEALFNMVPAESPSNALTFPSSRQTKLDMCKQAVAGILQLIATDAELVVVLDTTARPEVVAAVVMAMHVWLDSAADVNVMDADDMALHLRALGSICSTAKGFIKTALILVRSQARMDSAFVHAERAVRAVEAATGNVAAGVAV